MLQQLIKETCPGCYGDKVQTNNDGIRILCPACGGKGIIFKSNFDDLPPGMYCLTNG